MEDVVKSFLFVFATFLPIIDPFGGAMFFSVAYARRKR